MHEIHRIRVAFALKCDPKDVPLDDEGIRNALDNRIAALKSKKLEKVKNGEPIH